MERKRKRGKAFGTSASQPCKLCLNFAHPNPGNIRTPQPPNKLETDPFVGLNDEDKPPTCSLFEEKYFESSPPHLNRVGGLRTLIAEMMTMGKTDEKLAKKDTAGHDRVLGFMFLYLHFSSSVAEENKELKTRISSLAAEQIKHWASSQKIRCSDGTNSMIQLFLHELMKRVSSAIQNQNHQLPVNSTELALIHEVSCSVLATGDYFIFFTQSSPRPPFNTHSFSHSLLRTNSCFRHSILPGNLQFLRSDHQAATTRSEPHHHGIAFAAEGDDSKTCER